MCNFRELIDLSLPLELDVRRIAFQARDTSHKIKDARLVCELGDDCAELRCAESRCMESRPALCVYLSVAVTG